MHHILSVVAPLLLFALATKPFLASCPLGLHLVNLPRLHLPLKQQVPPPDIDQLRDAIDGVLVARDIEHAIQLFEGLALGLRHEEQDGHPADDVPGGVPGEAALGGERRLHRRPGDAEDEVEKPGGGGGERHAVAAHVQRIGFGRVGEGHGALAGGVDHAEEVDAERDASHAGRVVGFVWDPETEAGEEEEEGHEWVGGYQEVAAAEGVDGVDGGDGEEPVDDAEAEGGGEGADGGEAAVKENLGTVVGDDVDTTELKSNIRDDDDNVKGGIGLVLSVMDEVGGMGRGSAGRPMAAVLSLLVSSAVSLSG